MREEEPKVLLRRKHVEKRERDEERPDRHPPFPAFVPIAARRDCPSARVLIPDTAGQFTGKMWMALARPASSCSATKSLLWAPSYAQPRALLRPVWNAVTVPVLPIW